MKFSVGDRVLMKRTGEEGFVTAFLSKQIIEVEAGDVKFPVYADELEHPYLNWFTSPKRPQPEKNAGEIPAEKLRDRPVRLSRGIYLSFLPEFTAESNEDIIESFRIHLLNETAKHLLFSYHSKDASDATLLQLNGSLHPFANIFLHTLSLETLNEQPRFSWTAAPKDKPASGVNGLLRIRPAQLARHMMTLVQEGAPAFSVLLAQDAESATDVAPKTLAVVSGISPAGRQTEHSLQTMAEAVVDLHLDSTNATVEPAHILAVQLQLLQRKLDAAYTSGLEQIIVIHGIGTGLLREAVHDTLRKTPFVSSFSNEWMGAYGWGATAVFFSGT